MVSVMLATLLVITLIRSGYDAYRFWIGPAIKRHRARRRVQRLGIHAFMV